MKKKQTGGIPPAHRRDRYSEKTTNQNRTRLRGSDPPGGFDLHLEVLEGKGERDKSKNNCKIIIFKILESIFQDNSK